MFKAIFNRIRKNRKKIILKSLNGEYVISSDGRIAFLIDTTQKSFYVIDSNNIISTYKKDHILQINLEDENEKGYKRNLFSTLAWYQIGKMVDKVGGLQKVLSQWVTEKEIVRVKRIFLRVVVKDFNNPYYDLIFFENGFLSDKREAYKLATRWYSLLSVLKHQ